ncbi:MAG: hypothetical protein JW841_14300 [Deltaproteobacteria bacterium]|nr:hypothetical protein [Deltaproteobacteria bacterium]
MGIGLRLLVFALALMWTNINPDNAFAMNSSSAFLRIMSPLSAPAKNKAKKRKAKVKNKKKRNKTSINNYSTKKAAKRRAAKKDKIKANIPAPPPGPTVKDTTPASKDMVLDLGTVDTNTEDAKKELLKSSTDKDTKKAKGKKGGKGNKGGFDFGGGATLEFAGGDDIDFGEDLGNFDIQLNISSEERQRVERAMNMMNDEEYGQAALEYAYFISDPKFVEFKPESEYQLAKAMYKLGFLDASLKRFKAILDQGSKHLRYKKSVEWLFFISRKVADETPVLAELARFRNVTFPKAYRNEYRYLLSKYLFVQAQNFEVERMEAEQISQGKKSTKGIDFGALAEASKSDGFDFGKAAGGGLDFGSGGGMDFGGGAGGASGGFDFGAGSGDSGGGLDFSGGGKSTATADVAMTREAAPSTTKEAVNQGLELVSQVNKDSKFYPRAKYLEGLLNYIIGQDTKAVAAFQEVVRVLNPRLDVRLDPKLRELAFLSLARIHYGHKQFNKSVYYYDQIDRDSENWLTALFETSWAYYQRGDFEKALGNLLTLHSPFFEREYFPESQLVKAIIYFEACRYGETRDIIDKFIERFTLVMKAIEKIANSQEAPELLYERIAKLQQDAISNDDEITARVVSLALTDPDIRIARKVVQQVSKQLELWRQMPENFRTSRLGLDLNNELKETMATRVREAGTTTKRKFEGELYQLKTLLAQALRIKIEVARSERESIEKRMRKQSTGDELVPAVARTVVDDEHLYWPYEGEYWRDELGTYELDFSMCRPLTAGS